MEMLELLIGWIVVLGACYLLGFVLCKIVDLIYLLKDKSFAKKFPEYQPLVEEYNKLVNIQVDFYYEYISPLKEEIQRNQKRLEWLPKKERQTLEDIIEKQKEKLFNFEQANQKLVEKYMEAKEKIKIYCKEKGKKEDWG